MTKNSKQTRPKVAKKASDLLKRGKGSPAKVRSVAGSDLSQTKPKPKKK